MTPLAIDINDKRALHVETLVRDALRNMGKPIAAAEVLILGASYREDVGDTRYSGSEIFIRKLTEMGADVSVMDPYVEHWWELENQDFYPHPDYSWMRFFERQNNLSSIQVEKNLNESLPRADAIVFAVRHEQFLILDPDEVIKAVGKPCAIIDCFTILDDDKIKRYFQLGCEVKGMGRGHIQRIKKGLLTKFSQKCN